jgi:hypothetical protein
MAKSNDKRRFWIVKPNEVIACRPTLMPKSAVKPKVEVAEV